jgi:hypothetical protein
MSKQCRIHEITQMKMYASISLDDKKIHKNFTLQVTYSLTNYGLENVYTKFINDILEDSREIKDNLKKSTIHLFVVFEDHFGAFHQTQFKGAI